MGTVTGGDGIGPGGPRNLRSEGPQLCRCRSRDVRSRNASFRMPTEAVIRPKAQRGVFSWRASVILCAAIRCGRRCGNIARCQWCECHDRTPLDPSPPYWRGGAPGPEEEGPMAGWVHGNKIWPLLAEDAIGVKRPRARPSRCPRRAARPAAASRQTRCRARLRATRSGRRGPRRTGGKVRDRVRCLAP